MTEVLLSGLDVESSKPPALAGVLEETASAFLQRDRSTWQEEWMNVVDHTLIEWGRDLACLDDPEEGLKAPSMEMLNLSLRVVKALRAIGMPPPVMIAPDGKGGIAFQWKANRVSAMLEVSESGSAEFCGFVDHRLVLRHRFP